MLVREESEGATRVGEDHEERRDGLECEVGGEGVLLEGGELWAGEDAEGDYAADEGLEEGAAEEGAIAVTVSRYVLSLVGSVYLSRWYPAGFLKDDNEVMIYRSEVCYLVQIRHY